MTKLVPISQTDHSALKTMSSLSTMGESELIDRINEAYNDAQYHYKKSVVSAIMVGVLLSHAKENFVHGDFQQWIKGKLPHISYATANRYRKLAEGIRDNEKLRRATFDFDRLLQLPFLPDDEQAKLLSKVEKLTDGKSLTQLYFDFDVVKKPDPKGGARISAPGGDDKPAKVRQPTLEELTAAAKQRWKIIVAKVSEAHGEGNYALIPEDQRQAILATLYEVTNAIEEIDPAA